MAQRGSGLLRGVITGCRGSCSAQPPARGVHHACSSLAADMARKSSRPFAEWQHKRIQADDARWKPRPDVRRSSQPRDLGESLCSAVTVSFRSPTLSSVSSAVIRPCRRRITLSAFSTAPCRNLAVGGAVVASGRRLTCRCGTSPMPSAVTSGVPWNLPSAELEPVDEASA